ncbi:hypothetical protein [Streptomyces albus]|uniref:hypothetical protein n=1 Tax=Streptomyces albus TaxID=1888 RepID=UPI0033D0F7A6
MASSVRRFWYSAPLRPLFLLEGTVQYELGLATAGGVLFAVSVVPMAMLIGYAYERGGIVAAIAVHFAGNTTMVLLGVKAAETLALLLGLQALVAVLLLAFAPPRALPRTPRAGTVSAAPEPAIRV